MRYRANIAVCRHVSLMVICGLILSAVSRCRLWAVRCHIAKRLSDATARPLGVAIGCCMYMFWLWVWWAIMFGLTIYKIHYTGSPIGLPVLDLALCGAFLLSKEISLQ